MIPNLEPLDVVFVTILLNFALTMWLAFNFKRCR